MRLAERFGEELERVGGKSYLLEDLAEARQILNRIVGPEGSHPRVRWGTALAEGIDSQAASIDAALSEARSRELCLSAEIGITEADYALADSGTLVLESGPARSRMVSLLPPVHVVVLPEDRILAGLGSLVTHYAGGDGLSHLKSLSCLTFITGPSRTADIEQTLTLGAHGPQAVHVLIIRDRR